MIETKVAPTPLRFSDFPEVPEKFHHLHRWGPWLLDADRLVLCLCQGHDDPLASRYEVDIEEIDNVSDAMFWLSHITAKTWGTPEVVGHLMAAFQELFRPRSWLILEHGRTGPTNREMLMGTIERDW